MTCACGRTDDHVALSYGAARQVGKRPCSPQRLAERWIAAAEFHEAKGNKRVAAGFRAQAARSFYG